MAVLLDIVAGGGLGKFSCAINNPSVTFFIFLVTATGTDVDAKTLTIDGSPEAAQIISEGTKLMSDGSLRQAGRFIVKANKLTETLNKISTLDATIQACQTACDDKPYNFETAR